MHTSCSRRRHRGADPTSLPLPPLKIRWASPHTKCHTPDTSGCLVVNRITVPASHTTSTSRWWNVDFQETDVRLKGRGSGTWKMST